MPEGMDYRATRWSITIPNQLGSFARFVAWFYEIFLVSQELEELAEPDDSKIIQGLDFKRQV